MKAAKEHKQQQSRVIFSRKNVSRSQDIVQYKKVNLKEDKSIKELTVRYL